ncbi:MAG: hypothetical protein IJA34_13930 [Lachnospiraceae bacterium]|nr:hypothetical protein [Lachnospiraceae bacterium]
MKAFVWIFWIVVLLFLEFGIEVVKNEDNYFSRKVRIIVLIPITIFYIGGLTYFIVMSYIDNLRVLLGILIMLAVVFGAIIVWQWYNILKNK